MQFDADEGFQAVTLPTGELPRVSPDDTGGPPRPRRKRRHFRFTLKFVALLLVVWFVVLPQIGRAHV